MLRPLRLNDRCLCYCKGANGFICNTLQYSYFIEGLPIATVGSLCCTCDTVVSIKTGSLSFFIEGKNVAHEQSVIPCNTPIPTVNDAIIPP